MKLLNAALFSLVLGAPAMSHAQSIQITETGSTPTRPGAMDQFTGQVLVDRLTTEGSAAFAGSGMVSFAPKARTAWHTHPAGQWLYVTAGKGWVQEEGQPVREIKMGDAIWIPADTKHWHGATEQTAMSHVAVTPMFEGNNVTWLEQVSDADYGAK